MNSVIKQWLKTYKCETEQDYDSALKEIIQEIALCGLWRAKFFEKAAFYGGTALRIFYGLDRFSEDLDFSLLKPNPEINLEVYYNAVKKECESYGIEASIHPKKKTIESTIESDFLKSSSYFSDLSVTVQPKKIIKIKLEVDVLPPSRFNVEAKYLLNPIEFFVKTYAIESLFAGKMHAILCRAWKARVKGRDWYDLIFYVKHGYPLCLAHLEERMKQSGHLKEHECLTRHSLNELLKEKIRTVDFQQAKMDIERFIKEPQRLNIWSIDFFMSLIDKIHIQS